MYPARDGIYSPPGVTPSGLSRWSLAVTPPLLLALYLADTRDSLTRVLPAGIGAGFMWAFTIARFVFLIHDISVLNKAIATAPTG